MYVLPYAESNWEDQNPYVEAEINNHNSIFQYSCCDADGEATLYMVQNCERKKEEISE
jgi:hypothetical protein